ncbi:beta-ketoacyl synthase N-terminal-like domain-containing protein [Actinophytocola oryzae]|uniref:beta-ketoacyl synthase N-terminal-like domain-containing protein n=1 Tax=Actinophytocola oryzae TaxID=502181 RepID=UPI001063630B
MDRRVVVTGLGAANCLGGTVDHIFATLMPGRGGVVPTMRFDAARCPVRASGEIMDTGPVDRGISEQDLRTLERHQRFALAASDAALTGAGPDPPRIDVVARRKSPRRFDRYGAAIGTSMSSTEVAEHGSRVGSPRLFDMTCPTRRPRCRRCAVDCVACWSPSRVRPRPRTGTCRPFDSERHRRVGCLRGHAGTARLLSRRGAADQWATCARCGL